MTDDPATRLRTHLAEFPGTTSFDPDDIEALLAENTQIEGLENSVRNYEQWLAEECRKTEALRATLVTIREYLETSDDTGIRTREHLLGVLDQAGVPSVIGEGLKPLLALAEPECPYDYHEMADEGITCVCQPHGIGDAYGCPEGCPTHNPGGEDVPEGAIGGPATDDDYSYRDMVNAPLRPETIAALAKRIKAGNLPVRKVSMRGSYPAKPGRATVAADRCPQCGGDNTEAWALCGTCETAGEQQ